MKPLGQVAYETYSTYSLGLSLVTGAILPKWNEQNDVVRQAWQVAAEAVAEAAVQSFIKVQNIPELQLHRDETLFPRGDA